MSVYFPSRLKPSVSQGYSFGAGQNVMSVPTLGGAHIQVIDFKYAPVGFNVAIVGDRLTKMVMSDFYYAKLNSGTGKFYMDLDTGLGIEEHICMIAPGSIQFNGGGDPTWIITFTVIAERTPAQDAPYDGDLVDLYDEYGDDLEAQLDALGIYVNVTMPLYL